MVRRLENCSRIHLRDTSYLISGYIDVDKSEIIEDTELLDADVNSTYFIGIIVECFALLDKVPESIEVSARLYNSVCAGMARGTLNAFCTSFLYPSSKHKNTLKILSQL